jgi:putative transposase
MAKEADELFIAEKCELLGVSRSSVYYKPKPVTSEQLYICECIDKVYTAYPFMGYRSIRAQLMRAYGLCVNHKRVRRLMREMCIQAIYPQRRTSAAQPGQKVYPYLLKGLVIDHPNQVWGIDITYIPLSGTFMYLTAILDWYSRYVISWELSDTLEEEFVLRAARKGLSHARPEILNSDQGAQFTSAQFTGLFESESIRISMDHRGRCFDNIFTERLWRTVKYEDIYLKRYETPREVRQGLAAYFEFYNNQRGHQSLAYATPAEVYWQKAAAKSLD